MRTVFGNIKNLCIRIELPYYECIIIIKLLDSYNHKCFK